jgi:glycerol-3-phosphate cytidylyltransferase
MNETDIGGTAFEAPAIPGVPDRSAERAAARADGLVVGYVPGAYDLFHIGHLNILRRAREHCDFLIAGVVTDEVMVSAKGKAPVVPHAERMEIVANISCVDEVVTDVSSDKLVMWQRLGFDVLFKGDDWKGTPKGDRLESSLGAVGVRVVFFPYTVHTSSTLLRALISGT